MSQGESVRRCLVAGDEELHALAEDEFVGHAFAVGVAGVHQGLQEVLAGRLVAALLDVCHQDAVGLDSHLFVAAELAGDFKPRIQVGLQGLANDEFLDEDCRWCG